MGVPSYLADGIAISGSQQRNAYVFGLESFSEILQSLGQKHTHSHVDIQCWSVSAGNFRVNFNRWKIIISE